MVAVEQRLAPRIGHPAHGSEIRTLEEGRHLRVPGWI